MFYKFAAWLCGFFILLTTTIFYARLPVKNFPVLKNDLVSFPYPSKTFSPELKVVTYNIGYASGKLNNKAEVLTQAALQKNLAEIAQALKNVNADILFLQEVDFQADRTQQINQLEYLANALQMPFSASVILWSHRYLPWPYWPLSAHYGKVVSGQAVLSRYPILSQDIIPLEKPIENAFWYNWFYPKRALQKLSIQFGEEKISVYNIHFEAKHASTRLEQAKILVEQINQDHIKNKIVAGDFNSISFPALKKTDKNPEAFAYFLQNTALKNAETSQRVYSNRNTGSHWQPFQKIDHIFFSENFRLQSMGNTPSEGSDHLPIWAELELLK